MEDIQANEKKSAKRKMIKDLSNEDIGNSVQVVGFIKEIVDESTLLLSDQSGELIVEIEDEELPYEVKDLVCVYAGVEPTMEGELKLKSLFIQDMKGLNFENYKELYELKKDLI